MKKILIAGASLFMMSLLIVGCATTSPKHQDKPTITEQEAVQIFDYAYPLVIMSLSQDLMLKNPFRPHQKPNSLILFTQLAQPKNKAVVLGNRNTLYTVGWIDLSRGPVVFIFPDMEKRYFVMPLIDAWTNTFKSIGSRTTGQGGKKYFLVNAEFKGDTPEGFERIVCPTNMVWLTGRIQADNEEDSKKAAALQAEYKLMTHKEYMGGENPFNDWKAQYSAIKIRKPVPYSLKMKAKEFYDLFFKMYSNNMPLPFDGEMTTLLKRAGIDRSEIISFKQLNPANQMVLSSVLEMQQEKYLKDFYKGSSQKEPWIFNRTEMGIWGDDYTKRAYWAVWGLGANLVQDAVYGVTQLDSKLEVLNGENVYKIHIPKGGEPDVGAFWSITSYNLEGYLEANDVNRYATGSNMPVVYNEDGSLDIYLSSMQPKGVEKYNWIPTPKEDFKILFRMYWPKKTVLDGMWKLPLIVKE
ncbi:DUF1254 domain-containing protein [Prolixibacteraceae bacterium]|nr:DUF1254 domain-containing protein [Prolixibacteraceae bacterium]